MPNRKDVIRVLKKARKLVSRKGGWTKGANARDAAGDECDSRQTCARSFCMGGAILHSTSLDSWPLVHDAREAIHNVVDSHMEAYNDAKHRRQKQVIAAFDRAIKKLEQE